MAELVGIKEAAEIFGVSTVTIWRWVKADELIPIAKVGKQSLFDKQFVIKLAERRKSTRRTA